MREWHSSTGRLLKRYVLLERDGVINRRLPAGYVPSWERFQFLPRALEALRLFAQHGYTALVISNQSCVGQGLLAPSALESITRRFLMEVALTGGNIGQVYYCKHSEEEHCSCRKPLPGLVVRARVEHRFTAEETYFVGNSESDIAAAGAAGCPAIMIRRGAFLDRYKPGVPNQPIITSNLHEAAELIVALQRSTSALFATARR
jgi:D-glycero-D-manno-heptose 1,7-bisphosphate phosphatase